MRHLVNFALLFTFAALAVTGVLAFTRPFSLTTTHVHIVAGAATLVLVFLHLAGRIPYLTKPLSGHGPGGINRTRLVLIVAVWGGILLLAGNALPPVSWLLNQSYESRTRAQIARSSSLTGLIEPTAHEKLIRRLPESADSSSVSLYLSFNRGLETLPAVAVWAESVTGAMIETLYLQPSLAYSDRPLWEGVRTRRNHILPIWRHRYTLVSGINPDGSNDGVSGATESHRYALDPYLVPGKGNTFVIFAEINAPNDPNDHWTDSQLGQPSLLYSALIKVDEDRGYYLLEMTGHGGGAEESGAIQYDLDHITSARELADLLLLKVEKPVPEPDAQVAMSRLAGKRR